MIISIIAAISRNNVIGKDNTLIWNLPSDLKRFKRLTTGHHIIMGRKTFESIGKSLPNRTSIIITRNTDFKADECIIAHSLNEAIAKIKNDDEVFIIGGGTIYNEALTKADKIYLTLVHRDFEGDTFFPVLNYKNWETIAREDHLPDDKNPYPYSFIDMQKK